MPSRLVAAGSAEPSEGRLEGTPAMAPVRDVTVRGLVSVPGNGEVGPPRPHQPTNEESGLFRWVSPPAATIPITAGHCDLVDHRPERLLSVDRCIGALRLVHDETMQSAARPGWSVQCTEHPDAPPVELRVSVVIPTFNEARNLPSVLPQIPSEGTEIVVVDGHSSDGTPAIVRELCPDAVVIQQPGRGKGDALRTGFERATGDIVVMLDADGSMTPREIPAFVTALVAGADLAKGSRHLHGGGSADLTRLRSLGNQVLGWMFNRIHGTRHTDLCYGYMAFWRRSLPAIMPDCDGFEVETLLNVRAAQAGLRVVEVPSHEGRRVYGDSNLHPVRDGLRVLRTLSRELPRSVRMRATSSPPARRPEPLLAPVER
jgi:Glycosyl transferase family 2